MKLNNNIFLKISCADIIKIYLFPYFCDIDFLRVCQSSKQSFSYYSLYQFKSLFYSYHFSNLLHLKQQSKNIFPYITKFFFVTNTNIKMLQSPLLSTIQYLELGYFYNKPLRLGCLKDCKILILGDKFNQPLQIGDLPFNLETLIFGKEFNQKLKKNDLPLKLKNLEFGRDYDQMFEKEVLPSKLETLKMHENVQNVWYLHTVIFETHDNGL